MFVAKTQFLYNSKERFSNHRFKIFRIGSVNHRFTILGNL